MRIERRRKKGRWWFCLSIIYHLRVILVELSDPNLDLFIEARPISKRFQTTFYIVLNTPNAFLSLLSPQIQKKPPIIFLKKSFCISLFFFSFYIFYPFLRKPSLENLFFLGSARGPPPFSFLPHIKSLHHFTCLVWSFYYLIHPNPMELYKSD